MTKVPPEQLVAVLVGGQSDAEDRGLFYPLAATSYTVGRGSDCDLRLPESWGSVSRRHADFDWMEDSFEILDLGSKHGTWVNGARLEAGRHRVLCNGDLVRLGAIDFRFLAASPSKKASMRFFIWASDTTRRSMRSDSMKSDGVSVAAMSARRLSANPVETVRQLFTGWYTTPSA